jgi:cytochrome c-type biogenesis protein CcmH/NrfG
MRVFSAPILFCLVFPEGETMGITVRVLCFILLSALTTLAQMKTEQKPETSDLETLMIRQQQREEKLKALQQEVRENPHSAEAHFKLGKTYLEGLGGISDAPKALEAFQQAINIQPNYPEAFVGLGDAYLAIKMRDKNGWSFTEAREAYRQAIALKPDYAEAYYSLGLGSCSRKRGIR